MGRTLHYARHLVRRPGLAWAGLLMAASRLFRRGPFFLQGRMDIHPASPWHKPTFTARHGGFFPPGGSTGRTITPAAPWDQVRRDMLVLLMRSVTERQVPGDVAELGVYRGTTARLFHHYMPERTLHLFDTFDGFAAADRDAEAARTAESLRPDHFADAGLERARRTVAPRTDGVHFHPGRFPESCPAWVLERHFCLVHLDADLYEPTRQGLETFHPRMAPGGLLVIHDYNAWDGARTAVDEFFHARPQVPLPMPDKSGSAVVVYG